MPALRYLIGFLVTVGLIVLVVVLLVSGGGKSGTTVKSSPINLEQYATTGGAAAHLIVDGPIVSDAKHREIKIDVDANQVTATLYQGYDGNVIKSQTYPNNQSSFAVFLHAMQLNGLALGDNSKSLGDERGHCATGNRTIYSFDTGSKQLFRYWSTSCNSGTFKGQAGIISILFQQQVPDYNDVIAGSGI